MTQLTTTGYQRDVQGYWIEKDPAAQLIYSMDWSEWLLANDQVSSVTYTISNSPTDGEPDDITIEDMGTQLGYLTYCELSGGRDSEVYVVSAYIETVDGRKDTRRFKVKVKERYAK